MKRRAIFVLVVFLLTALSGSALSKKFPTVDEQLRKAHARPGTALDKLIRAHQDFSKLKDKDADDKIVPPWLKVYWQKVHADGRYDNADDPTGGYPLALKEVLEWMMTHQDLQPGEGKEAEDLPGTPHLEELIATNDAVAGTNVRASGAQTSTRSESDIRINYWDPQKILIASNNVSGSGAQGMYSSSDGGATWSQTNLPLLPGDSFHCDPSVDWSSNGTAWSTTIAGGLYGDLKLRSYRSTDGGATWVFDGTVSGTQTRADKPMQWIDHSATSRYKDQNYVIWHDGAAYMNRRTPAGWGAPLRVSGTETTGTALGGDVKTNSAGEVFGFYPDTGSRGIYIVKSTDGGTTYSTPTRIVTTYGSADIGIPASNNRRAVLYVSGGAYRNATTNNVYALWTDLSGDTGCTTAANEPGSNTASTCKTRVFFSRSTDGGATWSTRVKINDASALNDQFNAFLAVDETNGNLGAIYYDTAADPGRTKVDVYYQLSTDGGATWQQAAKVTTAMSDETVDGMSKNQFGDYNSLSGYANVFFPSWTDRRNLTEEIWTAKIATSPTNVVSGNAGASGVTITAGTASATSDATSSYKLIGLTAGTYMVTPSKPGCTFLPSSTSVTITSADLADVNFLATCTTPTFTIVGNVGAPGTTIAAGSSITTSDTSGDYALRGLTAGTYVVTPTKQGCTFAPASMAVTITSANALAPFTAMCGDVQLTSGVPVTGQSVALGAWKYYSIVVPAGAANLTFATSDGVGEVDIYTQWNAKPSMGSWLCRPYKIGPNEACPWPNPSAGTWWLGVYGGPSGGSYTVTATMTMATPKYSISGIAGTSGAIVTAGSASATSDSSNNYTITGLANGTYIVKPAKTGCTFTPASLTVTVNGAIMTNQNFSAVCLKKK